ncbi:BnaCnng46120D [Brassica napus]|uniref:BnaCnng46120D protein n=1 Tax=Brassica napus TaxID=3708 RepID=A0A078JEW3_BRANA|nr:BnaCnng46120D [Brassica napus]
MEFAKSVRDGDCSGGAGERTKSQIWAFLNAELGTTEKAGRGLQMSSNTQGRRHRHRSVSPAAEVKQNQPISTSME